MTTIPLRLRLHDNQCHFGSWTSQPCPNIATYVSIDRNGKHRWCGRHFPEHAEPIVQVTEEEGGAA